MIFIPRHLNAGAVVTIGILLLLLLAISKISNGTLQVPNQMPNQMMIKNATYTGAQGEEVDLRMPAGLLLTLQEGDLARELPATELRVPITLLLRLQTDKSRDASSVLEKPAGP